MDQFKHNILEQDLTRLSKEIAEKRALLEHKEVSERELVKQTLQPLIKERGERKEEEKEKLTEETILPNYLKDSSNEIKLQVKKLIDSVFHQGIEKTIKQAQQSGTFILDAFHDALTDKLYDELKKRKLI